ncbi:hypothetical protein MSG28_001841 [Choristoneura fumiferana]|uniref:Uncharacterized protein n=1 Tax=Choristoneura fumiferana TaxID=7141 RepID=A0ACC0KWE4_CHOFU|nr:hypothetical protein MSG28_001841 [Choristoneura fumiferana]
MELSSLLATHGGRELKLSRPAVCALCGSLTETARLLQNVRSVFSRRSATRANLELELSHGFAFSQEEGGSVSQSDVIRAYDTRHPRPARS